VAMLLIVAVIEACKQPVFVEGCDVPQAEGGSSRGFYFPVGEFGVFLKVTCL